MAANRTKDGKRVLPLHTYTIVDAINDKNVLPFRVDYIKTMDKEPDIDDKQVKDIDREKAFLAPERISLVTKYILDHFDQKTYRNQRTYSFNVLQNIAAVASASGRDEIEEIKQKQRLSGFNSIFAVSSVEAAKLYYAEFRRQMEEAPAKRLKIALIYSYGANEEEAEGLLDEENPGGHQRAGPVLPRFSGSRNSGLQQDVPDQLRHHQRKIPELLQGCFPADEKQGAGFAHRCQYVFDRL